MKKSFITAICFVFIMFSANLFADESKPVWLDVRSTLEFKLGSVDDALHIPHGDITERMSELPEDKNAKIYVFCGSGKRAGKALEILEQAGYTSVENLGGIDDARELQQQVISKQ